MFWTVDITKKPAPQATFAEVAKEHVQTPLGFQRIVVLPALRALSWVEIVTGALSESTKAIQGSFKHLNHVVHWVRHPGRIKVFFQSAVKLKNSFASGSILTIGDRVAKVYMKTVFAIELFATSASILWERKIISLSLFQIAMIGAVGFMEGSAVFIAALYGINKQFTCLASSKIASPEAKLALMRLITRISLAVIGIFGMVTFGTSLVISPLMWISFLTILLIGHLASHFYEKLYVKKSENFVAT